MDSQQRIIHFVTRANWVLLLMASAVGLLFFKRDVVLGLIVGGLLVTLNFHLLARTLKKAFRPPHVASIAGILLKYYIRFTITGVVIFFLMITHSVDPVGLITGLSVVVASITLAVIKEARQSLFKEAS